VSGTDGAEQMFGALLLDINIERAYLGEMITKPF
jgi:hypothetical protein